MLTLQWAPLQHPRRLGHGPRRRRRQRGRRRGRQRPRRRHRRRGRARRRPRGRRPSRRRARRRRARRRSARHRRRVLGPNVRLGLRQGAPARPWHTRIGLRKQPPKAAQAASDCARCLKRRRKQPQTAHAASKGCVTQPQLRVGGGCRFTDRAGCSFDVRESHGVIARRRVHGARARRARGARRVARPRASHDPLRASHHHTAGPWPYRPVTLHPSNHETQNCRRSRFRPAVRRPARRVRQTDLSQS